MAYSFHSGAQAWKGPDSSLAGTERVLENFWEVDHVASWQEASARSLGACCSTLGSGLAGKH